MSSIFYGIDEREGVVIIEEGRKEGMICPAVCQQRGEGQTDGLL